MKIQWLGHACFRLESGAGSLVLDPYADRRVPGLGCIRTEADAVYCSHEHFDHNARSSVRLTGRDGGLSVKALDCFHDEKQGSLRGSNKIHIISDGQITVAHCGDLGHMPAPELLAELQDLDALLIPVGGYYTIDPSTAQKVIEALRPRVVIPMHYRSDSFGYPVIAHLNDFLALRQDVVVYDSDSLILTADTAPQTAILRYMEA